MSHGDQISWEPIPITGLDRGSCQSRSFTEQNTSSANLKCVLLNQLINTLFSLCREYSGGSIMQAGITVKLQYCYCHLSKQSNNVSVVFFREEGFQLSTSSQQKFLSSRVTIAMVLLQPHRSIIYVTVAISAKSHVICQSAIHQFGLTNLCIKLHQMDQWLIRKEGQW